MNKINKNKIIIICLIVGIGFLFQPVLAEEAISTPSEPEIVIIQGCMDETAENYNSEADENDSSCVYSEQEPVLGCTDQTAENYNSEADENDSSCVYSEQEPVLGCTDQTAENYNSEADENDSSCVYPEPKPSTSSSNIEPQPQPQPQIQYQPAPEPIPDLAIAPSQVTIKVLMPGGNPPPFPVFVTFVGVGNKNFGGEIDANGELSVIMPQGRYYTELMVINTEYIQGEDGPSFFLKADEERNLGLISLISKSEQNKRGQTLEDQTLEDNLLFEAESAKGMGKILVLIVKLLMKILEEIRAIASQLAGK